ncbi:MAG: hypothetical protein MJ107_05480 [Lachnospiraceae bacterium]|nr:hypothetical protein [Lachnospiraceae bacterium]
MKDINLTDYRDDIDKLLVYLPWLESKAGTSVSRIYSDNNLSANSVPFPVYDSTLLNFVNEASSTGLMDENYAYAYTNYGIRSIDDEKEAISHAGVSDGALLCGIMSKYVLSGMRRGTVWSTAVTEGIFLLILKRMKVLLEIWDAPLA